MGRAGWIHGDGMSRADEIAQGLREKGGALTFPLDIVDYAQGHEDYRTGQPPPARLTSPSYDLGRARAARKAEEAAEFNDWLAAEDARRDKAVRDLLKDRPDLLAEYEAAMAAISAKAPA